MESKSLLQEELKLQSGFLSLSQETLLSLLRTSDLIRRYFSTLVRSEGITLQQYNVLRILRGSQETGLPTLEIANRMIEEAPGITRLVDKLESLKLLERTRCNKDRRQVHCRITQRGIELLSALDPIINSADNSLHEVIDKKSLEQILTLLEQIRIFLQKSSLFHLHNNQ